MGRLRKDGVIEYEGVFWSSPTIISFPKTGAIFSFVNDGHEFLIGRHRCNISLTREIIYGKRLVYVRLHLKCER